MTHFFSFLQILEVYLHIANIDGHHHSLEYCIKGRPFCLEEVSREEIDRLLSEVKNNGKLMKSLIKLY